MKRFVLAAVICLAGATFASEVNVGFRERGEIKVDAGATLEQTERVAVDQHGRLAKTGEGTLKLSRQAIDAEAPLTMDVLAGSAELTDGTALPAESVPACFQKAAFWVDASSDKLVTTNGAGLLSSDCMKAWYDVRETDVESPTRPYAVPDWWRGNNNAYCLNYGVLPPCRTTSYGNRTGLYFGGYGNGSASKNGQAALFMNPDGSQCDITNICHVFAVQAYSNSWGYIFGSYAASSSSSSSSIKDFHSGGSTYFHAVAGGAVAMFSGNTFLDGRWIDGGCERPASHPGVHLLECELINKLAHMQAFFRDSTWYENRAGGDYLFEVAIFTNRLTSAERAAVRRHLQTKWGIPQAGEGQTPTFALGANGTNILSVASGASKQFGGDVRVTGVGTVAKTGAGTLAVPFDLGSDAFAGKVDVREGNLELRRALTVPAQNGRTCDVASDGRGNAIAFTSGTAGSVIKTGRGRLQLEGLPDGTTRLDVRDGVLKLAAPRIDVDTTVVTGMVGQIEDPSFESYTNHADVSRVGNGRIYINTEGTLAPWTLVAQPGWLYQPSIAMYWMERFGTGNGKWPSNGYSSPDGSISMYVKGDAAAYTTVTIPADGVYEFSFSATARNYTISGGTLNGGGQNYLEIALGEDLDHLTWFGSLVRVNDPYTRFYYKTPRLAAGKYKLWFRARLYGIDGTTTIDDLKLLRVNEPEENVVKVPNGDFEQINGILQLTLAATNTCTGWEFARSWTRGGYSPVAVVSANAANANHTSTQVNDGRFFDVGGTNVYGFAALGLFSTGGVARTTSAFKPPAGTYRLRADVSRWSVTCVDLSKTSGATCYLLDWPVLAARVTVGEAVTELGTVKLSRQRSQPVTWSTTFTTDGDQQVSLAFWNTEANAGAGIDNVVLVPVNEGNLLKNPSFEEGNSGNYSTSTANWTLSNNKIEVGVSWNCDAAVDIYNRDTGNYATRPLDGQWRLRLRGLGSATQPVTLDEGLYRLKLHALSRCSPSGGTGYGLNPVRAYLTQNGVTNLIGWTYADFTNYVETAFVFRSPGAGTYGFTLQGMCYPGKKWNPAATCTTDNMAMIDLVSIEKLDETKYAATPDLPETAIVRVSEGARMELDFAGTNRIARLVLGGKSVARGSVVSQATHPDYVTGSGSLLVTGTGRGMLLFFR